MGSTPAGAGTAPQPGLRVESNAGGEIGLEARGVTIDEALRAIASTAGFEVVMKPGVQRPPVNVGMPMAPVEEVLRQILRGRNYALVYDADDATLSRVIVLTPPSVRNAGRGRWVRGSRAVARRR
jgi:hypothetical protein